VDSKIRAGSIGRTNQRSMTQPAVRAVRKTFADAR
jgi:hypothetical protein